MTTFWYRAKSLEEMSRSFRPKPYFRAIWRTALWTIASIYRSSARGQKKKIQKKNRNEASEHVDIPRRQ